MKQEYPMSLTIESVIGDKDACETMTIHARARLSVIGGNYTLSFTEAREGGRVFTTLSYMPGAKRVHMKSRGLVKSEIVFDPEVPHVSRYEVAPLAFDLTVRSREVSASLDENGGEIHLVYTRELAGDEATVTYHLTAVAEETET